MFLSGLQKLLEMVREEARRTMMMDSEVQKKAPRYVLATPVAIFTIAAPSYRAFSLCQH